MSASNVSPSSNIFHFLLVLLQLRYVYICRRLGRRQFWLFLVSFWSSSSFTPTPQTPHEHTERTRNAPVQGEQNQFSIVYLRQANFSLPLNFLQPTDAAHLPWLALVGAAAAPARPSARIFSPVDLLSVLLLLGGFPILSPRWLAAWLSDWPAITFAAFRSSNGAKLDRQAGWLASAAPN